MSTAHRKIKSVAKVVVPEGEYLTKKVLGTMKEISSIVGATLGPGGKQVLIERQEFGIPNMVTKDGVTVFRALGFNDPVAHAVMETARDASVRTATEAGDGTTTATVLSEAFVRLTHEYCAANPKVSPQRVVRTMERIFRQHIEPYIVSLAKKPDFKMLQAVAKCSTNGDQELTDAISECFRLTGDDGNVTLTESSGPSGYRVEPLKGYPAAIGYEDCVGKFFPIFINDQAHNRIYIEKPVFVLYHGVVQEFQALIPLLMEIGERWGGPKEGKGPHNVVVVACGFSDAVMGELANNWPNIGSLNVYPLVCPKTQQQSGQLDFLQDLQAVTGSTIFDPITRPVQQGALSDVGPELEYFEATRYRSNIVGQADEGLVLARIEELQAQLPNAEGVVEKTNLEERIGKLSGGIAKLIISAPTNGELREKRDRAEDAACAWRGAVKSGTLPGGGWTLLKIINGCLSNLNSSLTPFEQDVVLVMSTALLEPVMRLLTNCGYSDDEVEQRIHQMGAKLDLEEPEVFDALEGKFIVARESGVLDSTPAVLEAVRNSISIATLLGTLGGTIVFPRDHQLERSEASENYQWMRDAGVKQEE